MTKIIIGVVLGGAATLLVLFLVQRLVPHHPPISLGNCRTYLSELDPEQRAECVHFWGDNRPDSLSLGLDPSSSHLANLPPNPEDKRLDARGIK
jgi:hypothetical protein